MMHWLSSIVRFVALVVLVSSPYLAAEEPIHLGESAPNDEGAAAASCDRQDEVWLVSTRHLCFPDWDHPPSFELDVRRYDQNNGWQEASTAEFCAQPKLATVIYVHGNRVSWNEASQYGWQVYRALASCGNSPAAMRFVIWTWPSDQQRGPLRDIRAKADRADDETFFLGWFLSQQDPTLPVSLLGYSYGSRVITGGLHLVSGGSLCGITLPNWDKAQRAPARVALLAAAINHDWIYPGNCHGEALEQIDRLLVLYNRCDPVLQRYCFVDPCTRPTALGYAGVATEWLGGHGSRVEQLDVSSVVGRSHSEDNYFRKTNLREEVCRVLFHPLPTANGGD